MSGAESDTTTGVDEAILDAEVVDDAPSTDDPAEGDGTYPDITEEAELEGELVEMVEVAEKIAAERDEYLDLARRVQAEFENYKRRVEQQRIEQRERAAEHLVSELLPVLDAGEAAAAQGMEDVAAIHTQLLTTLEKLGLSSVVEVEVDFDPNVHEAVLHEEGDGDPVVAEVMRTGYLWNSRVLRPAMVKVRG
ncbi:MAG: nucleotide exchange factor GrpE [Microthrixaceae bacterium]